MLRNHGLEVPLDSFVFILPSFSLEANVTGWFVGVDCCDAAEVFVTVADSLWSCGIDITCVLPDCAVLANNLGGVKGFNFGREDGTDA